MSMFSASAAKTQDKYGMGRRGLRAWERAATPYLTTGPDFSGGPALDYGTRVSAPGVHAPASFSGPLTATPGAAYQRTHLARGQPYQQQAYRGAPGYVPQAYSSGGMFGGTGGAGHVEFSGPSQLSYQGARVTPHGMVRAARGSTSYEGRGPRALGPLHPGMFGNAMPTMRGYGADVDRVEGATYDRAMNRIAPDQKRARERLEQQLADQGITRRSAAHTDAMNRLDRSQADARENIALSSVAAGRAEHGRLSGLAQSLRRQEFGERQSEAAREFSEREREAGFNAAEAARGYAERADQQRFVAGERGRDYREQQGSEDAYWNKRLAGDEFAARQAARQDAQGIQQNQFNAGLRSREGMFGHQMSQADRHYGAGLDAADRRYAHGAAQADAHFGFNANAGERRYGHAAAEDARRHDAAFNQRAGMFGAQHAEGQRQYDNNFGAQQAWNADNFNAAQQQQNWANRFANAGFEHQQNMGRYANSLAGRQMNFQEQMAPRQMYWQQYASMPGIAAQNKANRDRGFFGSLASGLGRIGGSILGGMTGGIGGRIAGMFGGGGGSPLPTYAPPVAPGLNTFGFPSASYGYR